jgi:hypothetical protein
MLSQARREVNIAPVKPEASIESGEEFSRDYDVPLEAVREALEYVANNLPLIEAERDGEAADIRARGLERHQERWSPTRSTS